MDHISKIFMLLTTTHYVTLIKELFDASQIEERPLYC